MREVQWKFALGSRNLPFFTVHSDKTFPLSRNQIDPNYFWLLVTLFGLITEILAAGRLIVLASAIDLPL